MNLDQWFSLNDSKQINQHLDSVGIDRLNLVDAILTAVHPDVDWGDTPAFEVVKEYILLIDEVNQIRKLPLYANQQDMGGKKEKEIVPAPWDYPERMRMLVLHGFASAYGWSIEYCLALDALTAIKLYQEILVSTQLEHEREYNLSDKSTYYDKNTKKSVFVPMQRPMWMQQKAMNIVIQKKELPEHLRPVGMVISLNDLERT